jgi:hypothetical protein
MDKQAANDAVIISTTNAQCVLDGLLGHAENRVTQVQTLMYTVCHINNTGPCLCFMMVPDYYHRAA